MYNFFVSSKNFIDDNGSARLLLTRLDFRILKLYRDRQLVRLLKFRSAYIFDNFIAKLRQTHLATSDLMKIGEFKTFFIHDYLQKNK